jgi:8-oxo-dGTP pyrophosphatase MutT (NUDIX family)
VNVRLFVPYEKDVRQSARLVSNRYNGGMPAEPKQRKTRNEHSSGGAVISFRDGGVPYVALIATRGRTRWGLPKGAVSDGETSEQAALREVLEETGLEAEIVKPLDTIEYYFRAGDTLIRKRVDFYLMNFTGGILTPQLSEVDDVEWVLLSDAIPRASFESERKLLEMASREVEQVRASLRSSTPTTTSSSS